MDAWHRVGRIVRLSNLGTLIFFLLNIGVLIGILFPSGAGTEEAILLVICYLVAILLSLSPIGEWMLAALSGAHEIKRKDVKIRLIPLLEIVFEQATIITPSIVGSINLKIIYDSSSNAFAIGRKTICVTEGLLSLCDEDIMAVFSHELGHIAYKHSEIQLLIGGGNFFIAGLLLMVKLFCLAVTALFSIFAINSRNVFLEIVIAIIGSISSLSIWLWTKFCMLFLMWSMRQNEFVADEYAFQLGYGSALARVLDCEMCSPSDNELLKALLSSHPNTHDRIAHLQELGVSYSRYA